MRQYYVYILSSKTRRLYVGVTNDLQRRLAQHQDGTGTAFTSRYNIIRLVYYEAFGDVAAVIEREKQLKGWLRSRKLALVESENPSWRDLSVDLA
jgi:putative endonuclease